MYTRHGHQIPGTEAEDRLPNMMTARCGGPRLCLICREDAEGAVAAKLTIENKDKIEEFPQILLPQSISTDISIDARHIRLECIRQAVKFGNYSGQIEKIISKASQLEKYVIEGQPYLGQTESEKKDQQARIHAWEVGRGQPIYPGTEVSPNNPFLDLEWFEKARAAARAEEEIPRLREPERPGTDD